MLSIFGKFSNCLGKLKLYFSYKTSNYQGLVNTPEKRPVNIVLWCTLHKVDEDKLPDLTCFTNLHVRNN